MDGFPEKNEFYVLVPSFSLSGIRGRMDSGDTGCDLSAPAQPINLQGQLNKVITCRNCKDLYEMSPELLRWT